MKPIEKMSSYTFLTNHYINEEGYISSLFLCLSFIIDKMYKKVYNNSIERTLYGSVKGMESMKFENSIRVLESHVANIDRRIAELDGGEYDYFPAEDRQTLRERLVEDKSEINEAINFLKQST